MQSMCREGTKIFIKYIIRLFAPPPSPAEGVGYKLILFKWKKSVSLYVIYMVWLVHVLKTLWVKNCYQNWIAEKGL